MISQHFIDLVITKIDKYTLSYAVQTLSQAIAVVYNISSQQNISVTAISRFVSGFGAGNVATLGVSNQSSTLVSGFAYLNYNGSVCLTNILEQTVCIQGLVLGSDPNYDSTNSFKVGYYVGQEKIYYYEVTNWGLNEMNQSIVTI